MPTDRRVIELSHVIEDGMVTDPRLPPARVRDVWTREQSASRYAPGVSFQIAAADLVQNTGTYLDAPFHRFAAESGRYPGVWDVPIERVADLPGVCLDVRAPVREGRRALEEEVLLGVDVRERAVLFWTGADEEWGTESYRDGSHPFLTASLANALVEGGAVLMGLDAINADDFADLARPAHTILLGAGEGDPSRAVCIVENLTNLRHVAGREFRFTAAPARVRGLGSFPVRAFAVVGGCGPVVSTTVQSGPARESDR